MPLKWTPRFLFPRASGAARAPVERCCRHPVAGTGGDPCASPPPWFPGQHQGCFQGSGVAGSGSRPVSTNDAVPAAPGLG